MLEQITESNRKFKQAIFNKFYEKLVFIKSYEKVNFYHNGHMYTARFDFISKEFTGISSMAQENLSELLTSLEKEVDKYVEREKDYLLSQNEELKKFLGEK